MNKPKYRSETKKAIDEIAQELNLGNTQVIQDWAYEVANYKDIEKYINHYKSTTDSDKQFVLMQIIIQATEDQKEETEFVKYWNIVKNLLSINFQVHEYTIYYWSVFGANFTDSWRITPFMREVWNENQTTNH